MNDNTQSTIASKNLSALIIDDDDFQLELTNDLLQDIGIQFVAKATNGSEALTKYKSFGKRPDLIICDLQMPGMDGFDFMSSVAKLKFDGALIIVSGQEKRVRHSASLVAQLSRCNFLAEMEKPIDRVQLKSLISQIK
jgi:CheY-like chemotaxis protein